MIVALFTTVKSYKQPKWINRSMDKHIMIYNTMQYYSSIKWNKVKQMNFQNIQVKTAEHRRSYILWFHLCEIFIIHRSIETKHRLLAAIGRQKRVVKSEEMGRNWLTGMKFHFVVMEMFETRYKWSTSWMF